MKNESFCGGKPPTLIRYNIEIAIPLNEQFEQGEVN